MPPDIEGFTDYRVDSVLKFGGSLTRDLAVTKALIETIVACRADGERMIVVPGGGRTDKTIEALDDEQPLSPETFHHACALAQDQTGLILSDVAFSDALTPCTTIAECLAALEAHKVAVLLPAKLILDVDPIARTWEVTSDGVAAWVAWLVHAQRLAILTDVDGIYLAGNIGDPDRLLARISHEDLCEMGHTSIDKCAAAFLLRHRMEAAVLNGTYPDRLRKWMKGENTVGTRVLTDPSVLMVQEVC